MIPSFERKKVEVEIHAPAKTGEFLLDTTLYTDCPHQTELTLKVIGFVRSTNEGGPGDDGDSRRRGNSP